MRSFKSFVFGRSIGAWASAVLLGVLSSHARADTPEFVPQQALVKLVPGASISAFNARNQTVTLGAIPSRRTYLLQLSAAGNEPSMVDAMRADPAAIHVDLNYYADDPNPDGSTQSIFLFRTATQYQNDPSYAAVRASQAQAAAIGTGVVVAVLDSGCDVTHPALAGKVAPGAFDFILNQPGAADVGDGLDSNNNGVADENVGHGTLTAGIIARVAPGAKVLPIRVLDSDGLATTFNLAAGIYHAIDSGAQVINISLGTTGDPGVLQSAIAEANTAGRLIVAAAGNDDASSPPRMPAGAPYPNVAAVGAVAVSGVRAPFSNFGAWLTLSAPGVSVVSLTPGGGYGEADGTSFAAPFVAGAAALALSACTQSSANEIVQSLRSSSAPIDHLNPGYEGQLGGGLLDAEELVSSTSAPGGACGCAADIDGNGSVDVMDLFMFLDEWFVMDGQVLSGSIADFDANGAIDVVDLFGFVDEWFASIGQTSC